MECKESAEIKRDTITLLSWFIALLQCLLNKTININLSPESCADLRAQQSYDIKHSERAVVSLDLSFTFGF